MEHQKDRNRHWFTPCSASSGSVLLCCLFYTTIEYLYPASSLQLKYLSAQFGRLQKQQKNPAMFVRLSLSLRGLNIKRALWFWNFKSLKNCTVRLHGRRRLLCFLFSCSKNESDNAIFCCFVSTTQIFKYLKYPQSFAAPKPRIKQRMFLYCLKTLQDYLMFCLLLRPFKHLNIENIVFLSYAASNNQISLPKSRLKMKLLVMNENLSSAISESSKILEDR